MDHIEADWYYYSKPEQEHLLILFISVDRGTKLLQKNSNFQALSKIVIDFSSEQGLSPKQLESLIDVVASSTYCEYHCIIEKFAIQFLIWGHNETKWYKKVSDEQWVTT